MLLILLRGFYESEAKITTEFSGIFVEGSLGLVPGRFKRNCPKISLFLMGDIFQPAQFFLGLLVGSESDDGNQRSLVMFVRPYVAHT
jgi:hypothetical protein